MNYDREQNNWTNLDPNQKHFLPKVEYIYTNVDYCRQAFVELSTVFFGPCHVKKSFFKSKY